MVVVREGQKVREEGEDRARDGVVVSAGPGFTEGTLRGDENKNVGEACLVTSTSRKVAKVSRFKRRLCPIGLLPARSVRFW